MHGTAQRSFRRGLGLVGRRGRGLKVGQKVSQNWRIAVDLGGWLLRVLLLRTSTAAASILALSLKRRREGSGVGTTSSGNLPLYLHSRQQLGLHSGEIGRAHRGAPARQVSTYNGSVRNQSVEAHPPARTAVESQVAECFGIALTLLGQNAAIRPCRLLAFAHFFRFTRNLLESNPNEREELRAERKQGQIRHRRTTSLDRTPCES